MRRESNLEVESENQDSKVVRKSDQDRISRRKEWVISLNDRESKEKRRTEKRPFG